MDQISYQNGFVCGMATKGLVRSGQLYQPIIYNDAGVYDYFYIDFRRALEPFSLGMWNESIIVHDSVQLAVTQVSEVSFGVYKVTCDISGKTHGITVINKKTSRLRFASTGERVPVFSTHMYISGVLSYVDGGYIYDPTTINFGMSVTEIPGYVELAEILDFGNTYDSDLIISELSTVADTATVILT